MQEQEERPRRKDGFVIKLINRPGGLPAYARIFPDGRSEVFDPLISEALLYGQMPDKGDEETAKEVKGSLKSGNNMADENKSHPPRN